MCPYTDKVAPSYYSFSISHWKLYLTQRDKKRKGTQGGKEEIKLSLFTDDMNGKEEVKLSLFTDNIITYVENLKKTSKKKKKNSWNK